MVQARAVYVLTVVTSYTARPGSPILPLLTYTVHKVNTIALKVMNSQDSLTQLLLSRGLANL